jgi:parvulin-like peptidyl-prolyl isomerase
MRKVRHLLITINDQLPDHSRSDSLTLACDILEKTGQNSHAFIQQIKLHSECPTTLHDGLVGTLPKGKLYPELDALLFTMQPGEISGPVETEMGWHLLWCEAIHPASYLCLETIRHEIRGHLKQLKQKRALQRWKTLLQPYQPVIKAIE